jgi:hypothetical protein
LFRAILKGFIKSKKVRLVFPVDVSPHLLGFASMRVPLLWNIQVMVGIIGFEPLAVFV